MFFDAVESFSTFQSEIIKHLNILLKGFLFTLFLVKFYFSEIE